MNDTNPDSSGRPSIVRVDLRRLPPGRPEAAAPAPWRGSSEGIDRVGAWSGTALALALLHEHEVASPGAAAPLVVSIGECVRRALPTAARATVASRAPLTGLLADGQVGSDLGRRLARIADALVVEGTTTIPGAVLELSTDGRAGGRAAGGNEARIELLSYPELVGADPVWIHRTLNGSRGPCATLRTGRAGARCIPFACLAAGDDPPSFVGRGGLGAVLGRLGLSAIAIRASPVEPDPEAAHEVGGADLTRLLARSPRLRARAEGGTLEVAGALAAGGNLRGTGRAGTMSAADARAWSAGLATGDRSRQGCAGCPTPCGLVFERGFPGEDARRQGARFGALFALGPNLGLDRAEDALALLFACDQAALDAIETGAALALLSLAREQGRLDGASGRAPWGDREAMLVLIEDLVQRRGEGRWLALGASRMARELGLASEVRAAKGQGARADASLAAVLGQCAGARGSDPMRTFPFLLADASPDRLRELLAPIPLPRGAEDPRDPAGKGRIVWWHENLMAAIDASGFCAFSAAGLLADGVCDLDQLAAAIAPALLEPRSGRGLLAAGASIVTVARDLNRRFGARVEDDFPPWARRDLEQPGMWPEYAAMRGLDTTGGPSAETWSRLASESILDVGLDVGLDAGLDMGKQAGTLAREVERLPAPHPAPTGSLLRARGRVSLRCSGPLARELGAAPSDGLVLLDVDLPASLREVLAAAARERPRALRYLLQKGEPIPAAYRASRRLAPDDLVADGDELDLVVALSGGRDLS